jgi:hypothetical protein
LNCGSKDNLRVWNSVLYSVDIERATKTGVQYFSS